MSEFLVEIVSGEIPAGLQSDSSQHFCADFSDAISRFAISKDYTEESWSTPRRIGFCLRDIYLKTEAAKEEVRGPKDTAPEQALLGFLNKYKLDKKDVYLKDGYYFAQIGGETINPKELLAKILKETMLKFTWPKSMKWNGEETWIRPINSIIALLDGEVVNMEYASIASSNWTVGHRFYSEGRVEVSSYESYKQAMAENIVILEPDDRQKSILTQAEAILKPKHLRLVADIKLLNEIVGLVESPKVILSSIDEEFMMLPREILVVTLKTHQRYLMVEDEHGVLAPLYCIVSNIDPEDPTDIIEGNNSVLRARLYDAKFFFEQDTKTKLIDNVDKLKTLTYHHKIGSYYDKQASVEPLALKIAELLDVSKEQASRAVWLAKADLVSNVVKEMPELQGIIGYYYALANNEDQEVAISIRDHYKPQGPNDSIPCNKLAIVIALADKLDTLQQMFDAGVKPTGSKDPYALRRAALGIVRIAKEHSISVDNLLGLIHNKEVKEFILERV